MKNNLMKSVKSLTKNKKFTALMKVLGTAGVAFVTMMSYGGYAFADDGGADFDGVVSPIIGLINSFVNPLLGLVAAGGTLFCIMLGVKYATAEEPQEKEKRKQALKTAIIGFVLIFVLIVALKLSIEPLSTWMQNSTNGANTSF